ncbi:MAG: hypothetical protein RIS47_718 [Bacteroidota bacterium]|jgi:hypothetical protein
MKNLILAAVLFCCVQGAFAQAWEAGFMVGIGYNLPNVTTEATYNDQLVSIASAGSNNGYRAVAFARYVPAFFPVFIQFDILAAHTSGGIAFGMSNFGNENFPMSIDRFVPTAMVGIRFTPRFRISGGPVYSFTYGSTIKNEKVMEAVFKPGEIGMQFVAGLDYGNLCFDLRYESTFAHGGYTEFRFQNNGKLSFYKGISELSLLVGYRFGDYSSRRRSTKTYK